MHMAALNLPHCQWGLTSIGYHHLPAIPKSNVQGKFCALVAFLDDEAQAACTCGRTCGPYHTHLHCVNAICWLTSGSRSRQSDSPPSRLASTSISACAPTRYFWHPAAVGKALSAARYQRCQLLGDQSDWQILFQTFQRVALTSTTDTAAPQKLSS